MTETRARPPLRDRIARVTCCPGTECISPSACYLLDRSRPVPVDIWKAAAAVEALFCEVVKDVYGAKQPGPYSVVKEIEK